jgi:hypothetical protein
MGTCLFEKQLLSNGYCIFFLSRGRCPAKGIHATIFLHVLETSKMKGVGLLVFVVTFSKHFFFIYIRKAYGEGAAP